MRILCSEYIKGEPAPFFRHQDGFDVIGIFCARREKEYGISELYIGKEDEDAILEKMLEENELLVVNDREVFHNATKLSPVDMELGYRDVFVFDGGKDVGQIQFVSFVETKSNEWQPVIYFDVLVCTNAKTSASCLYRPCVL